MKSVQMTRVPLVLAVIGMVILAAGCPPPTPTKAPSVTVTPGSATLEVAQILDVTASSTDAADTSFAWASADPDIATVSPASGTAVAVRAVAPGTTTITATGSDSKQAGTVTVAIPVGGEGEGEGEGEGQPIATLAPGLTITIAGVSIPADLMPVVTFTATDNDGQVVPLREMSDVRFILDYLMTPAGDATPRFISYTTVTAGEGVQAAYDGAKLAGVTQAADGTMTYKFKSAIPATFDATATHAIGGQFQRVYPVDGKTYIANAVLDFRPDGGAVTDTREIVETATCNQCHTRLEAHGGPRRDVKLCILCHSTVTSDAAKTPLDFPVLIHKIHYGSSLPSVVGGAPYQIIGFQNSVNDFSTVVFPQDIRHCTKCHNTAPQADFWQTKPGVAGCLSCHDRTWFGDATATPAGYTNHPFPILQLDDSTCAGCHTATAPGLAPIDAAHVVPQESSSAPGLDAEITKVNADPATGSVQIAITAKFGDGTPITDLTKVDRLAAVLGYPTTDYQTGLSETIQGTAPPPGVLDTTTSPTGTYNYTFKATVPTGTHETFAVALAGRVPFTYNGTKYTQGIKANSLTYFTTDGSTPVPRRTVVESADHCNNCHGELRHHGDLRVGTDLCVLCHNPDGTDAAARTPAEMPPETIHFKVMIHKIHRGTNLENPYTVSGTDFTKIRFPGDLRQCSICHVDDTNLLPTPDGALPTVVTEGATVISTKLPMRAACTACHDADDANAHTLAQTVNDVESCTVCHGPGADFDVPVVHAIEP